MKRYHIIFKGRVQGVGFRYTAKQIANSLGLTGSVKNLYNGDVEVYIQGDEDKIKQFTNNLNDQTYINITSTDMNEINLREDENSFEIVR